MIRINNLCKNYGEQVVLDKLNLEIKKGEITSILGKSGVGKTTLIRILMGLEKQDSGEVFGLENEVIVAVFQEDRLSEHLDVYTNLVLPHIGKPSFKKLNKAILDNCMSKIGLNNCGTKLPTELSGGMKRRVAVLRALLTDFDLLILDEPFKGLDLSTKQLTVDFLKEYTQNKTVIYITHYLEEITLLNVKNQIELY